MPTPVVSPGGVRLPPSQAAAGGPGKVGCLCRTGGRPGLTCVFPLSPEVADEPGDQRGPPALHLHHLEVSPGSLWGVYVCLPCRRRLFRRVGACGDFRHRSHHPCGAWTGGSGHPRAGRRGAVTLLGTAPQGSSWTWGPDGVGRLGAGLPHTVPLSPCHVLRHE